MPGPGVELYYTDDIVLASNWNLGAGVVNTAAALADPSPVLIASTQLGNSRYYVAPGAESRLYNDFTDFIYRVGGVASGAAPVLTLRAGGNLDIRGSITDGFFAFSDQTDPLYLSYQLGGGNQQIQPTFNFACGVDTDCSVIPPFDTNMLPRLPNAGESITVNFAVVSRGERAPLEPAPYSDAANSPGALGLQDGAGDPIGSAALAPRLTDGTAADSASYRFVAGARLASADPLTVAPETAASVSVSGETRYRVVGTRGQPVFTPDVGYTLNRRGNTDVPAGDIADIVPSSGADPQALTRLTFGAAPAQTRAFLRERAALFFADKPGEFQLFGPAGAPTALTASLTRLTEFLAYVDLDLPATPGMAASPGLSTRLAAGQLGYAPLTAFAPNSVNAPTQYVRSLVRTGSGSIDIAAAGDVDLRGTDQPVYRLASGGTVVQGNPRAAQVGGTSVYTAGVTASLAPRTATVAGTNLELLVDPSASADFSRPASPLTPDADGSIRVYGVLQPNLVYAEGGGDLSVRAGRDVAARRDVASEVFRSGESSVGATTQQWRVGNVGIDAPNAPVVGTTNIRINPQLFSTGVGALGGGNVDVVAGRDIRELAVVADTSVTTGSVDDPAQNSPAAVLATFGHGNVSVVTGRDLLGGQIDVASGVGAVDVGGKVASAGLLRLDGFVSTATGTVSSGAVRENLTRLRVTDAELATQARQSITIGSLAALGTRESTPVNGSGFYTAASEASFVSNGDFTLANTGFDARGQNPAALLQSVLLPASLDVASLFGDIDLLDAGPATSIQSVVLFPSPIGQLHLYAGGRLQTVTLSMDDGDPSLAPGALSGFALLPPTDSIEQSRVPRLGTRPYTFPVILPNTSDADRRLLHNPRITHAGDPDPVRIAVDGSIDRLTLATPKATRLSAGGDLVDTVFIGQNVAASDVTRITAGRDIIGTTRVAPVSVPTATGGTVTLRLPTLQGNTFALGGPGTLFVEAGRDLGPFFNSGNVAVPFGPTLSYAGGIITVGNDYNPWLGTQGAKIYAEFGVGKGANYDALRKTYVDPANVANLDGDLFAQGFDANDNRIPDRTKPIYAPALVAWLLENAPDALSQAFGAPISLTSADVLPLLNSLDAATRAQFLVDLPYLPSGGIRSSQVVIDRRVARAPTLLTPEAAATAFAVPPSPTTISGSTLIGWLAQNAPDVLRSRFNVSTTSATAAYTALTGLDTLVQRQFLLDTVYFNELSVPARPTGASFNQYARSYRAVELLFPAALGYTANDTSGVSNGGTPVLTGNLDLRLATIETQRGGDVTILGPGGRAVAGSVVATSAQAARRGEEVAGANLFQGQRRALGTGGDSTSAARIASIPLGFEGVLTLRGGGIRSFTDGDFLLNQSRLFTQAGGDITLFSSNGDLNAGQGPRTAANFPPVVLRFTPNGFSEVDTAGAVAGAGIAAFQPRPDIPAPDVILVAPVGTVDAGDAGVRAAGNVFIAAAQVANAVGISAGGSITGSGAAAAVDTTAAANANAAGAAGAAAAAAVNPQGVNGGDRTRITVDVLGFGGDPNDDPCRGDAKPRPTNCPAPTTP